MPQFATSRVEQAANSNEEHCSISLSFPLHQNSHYLSFRTRTKPAQQRHTRKSRRCCQSRAGQADDNKSSAGQGELREGLSLYADKHQQSLNAQKFHNHQHLDHLVIIAANEQHLCKEGNRRVECKVGFMFYIF